MTTTPPTDPTGGILTELDRLIRAFRAKYPPPPEIRESPYATTRPWVFPKHRFFEWEAQDEAFCRKFGIGQFGPPEPCILKIADPTTGREVWYVHPTIMAKVRAELRGHHE